MNALEALVWIVGILTIGITIRYTIEAFAKAKYTVNDVRGLLKKEGTNEAQNDSEGR